MAIDQIHCDMLNGTYNKIRPLVELNTDLLLSPLSVITSTLNAINDNLLDNIDSVLDTVSTPTLDNNNLIGSLANAINDCPALGLIFPQSIVSQVQSGTDINSITLPNKFLNEAKRFLKDTLESAIDSVLDPFLNSACIALYKYEQLIKKIKLPELLDQLNQLETCLVTHCGTITEQDKIHNGLLTTYKLTSSYEIDITTLALEAGLTPTSLFAAYASYKNKIEI